MHGPSRLHHPANGSQSASPALGEIADLDLCGHRMLVRTNQGEAGEPRRHVGNGGGHTSMHEADLLLVEGGKVDLCLDVARLDHGERAADVLHELLALEVTKDRLFEIRVPRGELHHRKYGYLEPQRTKRGQRMGEQLRAFQANEWDAIRASTDTFGEKAIGAVLHAQQTLAFLKELDAINWSDQPYYADLPTVTRDFIDDDAMPPWATDETRAAMIRACQVFDEAGPMYVLALLHKSLPECYAAAYGAHVLTSTGRLGSYTSTDQQSLDILVRRVVETAHFILEVMDAKNWEDGSKRALRVIKKIRLFHAGVRLMQLQKGTWDEATYGKPINHEDELGTLLAFSYVAITGLRTLGVHLKPEDEEAIITHWRVVGYYLGIVDHALPTSMANAADLWHDIDVRQFRASDDGKLLTQALSYFLEQVLFDRKLRGMPNHLMNRLMDKRMLDMLGVPLQKDVSKDEWTGLERLLTWLCNLFLHMGPIGRAIFGYLSKRVMLGLVEIWNGKRPVRILLETELKHID